MEKQSPVKPAAQKIKKAPKRTFQTNSCCSKPPGGTACCTPVKSDVKNNAACCEQPKDGLACCDK